MLDPFGRANIALNTACGVDEWAAEQDAQFQAIFSTPLLLDLQVSDNTALVISPHDRSYALADQILPRDSARLGHKRARRNASVAQTGNRFSHGRRADPSGLSPPVTAD